MTITRTFCSVSLLALATVMGPAASSLAATDYASGYDNRTSLILFRHPGVNTLVQCGILYDVTRSPRTVVNCYELR